MGARELLVNRALAVGVSLSVVDGKLIATPLAALPDDLRAELRAHRVELVAALSSMPPPVRPAVLSAAPARTCADCLHQLKYRTCGEPVAAGLTPHFEITWPPESYGAGCTAFAAKAAAKVVK